MCASRALSLVMAWLVAGCVSGEKAGRPEKYSKERAEVQRRLEAIFDAAEKKEMDRLDRYHLYGPHFTKFSGGSLVRQNAAAARQGEHQGLTAIDQLSMAADDLQIEIIGRVAIATFVLRYGYEIAGRKVRRAESATLVFRRVAGEWKIVHEHLSPPAPRR